MSPVAGNHNYGAQLQWAEGPEFYSVIGVWETDEDGAPRLSADAVIPVLAHELSHSFVNPVVNAHSAELENALKKLFEQVEDEMTAQAYGRWQTMAHESMVRACTARYLAQNFGAEAANQSIELDLRRSFLWARDLAGLMGDYEADRVRYPDLDSFMPRVVEFFETWARPN